MERDVPVPIEVVNELAKYLESRGLDKKSGEPGQPGRAPAGSDKRCGRARGAPQRRGQGRRAGRGALAVQYSTAHPQDGVSVDRRPSHMAVALHALADHEVHRRLCAGR